MRRAVGNGGTYNQAAYDRVAQLRRAIAKLEEQIDERKAELRPGVIESLNGPVQRPTTTVVQKPQETQTERFTLGEGGRVAQNRSTTVVRRAPFSGKIRAGDILSIEIVGGFPNASIPPRTVEPDGNLVLNPAYGIERIAVGGRTLVEAGNIIEAYLKKMLRDPRVLVTYAGHDPDVIAEGEATATTSEGASSQLVEPVVLAPLDTIEVRLGTKSDYLGTVNGLYFVEPDGRVAVFDRRLEVAGLSELEAGNAIRTYLSRLPGQRRAPPSVNVTRRGRAVFPEDKLPSPNYRVRPGDTLLLNRGYSPADGISREVAADGNLDMQPEFGGQEYESLHIEGLTLDEVQKLLRESWKIRRPGLTTDSQPQPQPWVVTIGGWHEEADPAVIDRLGESADQRMQQLERELQQIKTMIHTQQR